MKKITVLLAATGLLALIFFRNANAKILIVGDIFFDRYIRQVAYNKGGDFIFSCMSDYLYGFDAVVGNLEGPITVHPSVSLGSTAGSAANFVFTFPTTTTQLLAENNIKIVNLGNNHIGNFGKDGIKSTREYLKKAGVDFFGGLAGDEPVLNKKINGQNLTFISYNEFGGIPAGKVAEIIKEEKEKGKTVIVYAHWGDEYSGAPARVKNTAKLFAENGADLIVGSHPHIILPSEKMDDAQVYYSLGNFIFDQYWNEEVSTGLVLEAIIKNGKIEIFEHKVKLNKDGTTCLVY